MAGFLYYIGGYHQPRSPSGEELTRWGLAHLVGANLAIRETVAGPDGQAEGLILAVEPASLVEGGQAPAVGFYPERQIWQGVGSRVPGLGSGVKEKNPESEISPLVEDPPPVGESPHRQVTPLVSVGWETERPPGPLDLERPNRRFGHDVDLDDGNSWHIPAARYLPQKLQLVNGAVRYVPKKEFAAFETAVTQCWLDYVRDSGVETTDDPAETERWEGEHLSEMQQVELAVGFLGLNYRVRLEAEINALGLFDQVCLVRVLEAILDIPGWIRLAEEMHKKKSPSGRRIGGRRDGGGAATDGLAVVDGGKDRWVRADPGGLGTPDAVWVN